MPADGRSIHGQYKQPSWQAMPWSGRRSRSRLFWETPRCTGWCTVGFGFTHSWLIGAATFALAGGFQFSPLKERCLKQCRSPFSFFVRYYRKGVGAAWRLGLRHGAFCLGCCWALMLVMFGLGVSSLVWMAVLAGVMVIEKTFPGGQRLSPSIGVALLGLAVLWLVHPAWLSITGV